jgi:hypothetical protein
MSQSTFDIIDMALLIVLVISTFLPYQRFNIAINARWHTSSVTDKGD